MRIFKNKWFIKYAQKEDISDEDLRETVKELESGLIDADYRDGVYKKRIARKGERKRGGYRVIVFFRSGDKTFFVYGFAKSDMGNISKNQAKDFRATARYYLVLTDEQIEERVINRTVEGMMKKNYRDEIAMVCHEMMEDLYKSGIVPDSEMRKFEKNCFADETDTAPRSIGVSKTVTPALAKRR